MNREIMKKIFPEEVDRVIKGHCPLCDKPVKANEFRDFLSKKEFAISGLCQKCQDITFKGDSCDEDISE